MTNILFFDTETNGLPITKNYDYYHPKKLKYYNNCRIIDIAYIICDKNGETVKIVEHLIKPIDFAIDNTHIHGITLEQALNNGIDIEKMFDELYEDLKSVNKIMSHNINFDINILLAECYRSSRQNIIDLIFSIDKDCTMNIGKIYMNTFKNPKLVDLYRHLFNKEVKQEHRALSDTKICTDCYYKMLDKDYIAHYVLW